MFPHHSIHLVFIPYGFRMVLRAMEERNRSKIPLLLSGRWHDRNDTQNRKEYIKSILIFILLFKYKFWMEPALVLQGTN